MPKVTLGKPNYELLFGAKLKGAIIGSCSECAEVASKIGIKPRTMSNRFKKPSDMTLGELKRFIKATELPPEEVIQYLYEKKQ